MKRTIGTVGKNVYNYPVIIKTKIRVMVIGTAFSENKPMKRYKSYRLYDNETFFEKLKASQLLQDHGARVTIAFSRRFIIPLLTFACILFLATMAYAASALFLSRFQAF